ncbi:MAG: nucleotidyltransferase domain-containing protein [Clostridia bacterium]|nr:nucleotidyltransferase domain-containing protein [Clostridia bacterium]
MPNIPTKINKIIDEFVTQVNKLLGNRIKKIILYGSYARGDYNESSDIDIMILTDLSDDEMYSYFVKISDIAYDIEETHNFNIQLSPLVKNINKFNYWLEVLPFYINVKREGVVLSEC